MMRMHIFLFCLLAYQYLQAQPNLVSPLLPDIPNKLFNVKDFAVHPMFISRVVGMAMVMGYLSAATPRAA